MFLRSNDNGIFTQTIGGVEIVDPLTSSCGRFVYDPANPGEFSPTQYGWKVEDMGGNCTAWMLEARIGAQRVYLLATNGDSSHEVLPGEDYTIGLYLWGDTEEVMTWTVRRGIDDETGLPLAPTDINIPDARVLNSLLLSESESSLRHHEQALCDLWGDWCAREGLECRSADEMDRSVMTDEQRAFTDAFIVMWDEVVK